MLNTEMMLYLDDQLDSINLDLIGTDGNIFSNNLPEGPDTAIMVESTGGSPQNMRLPFLKDLAIRILVRGKGNPRKPRKIANNIVDAIGTYNDNCFACPEPTEGAIDQTWEEAFHLDTEWQYLSDSWNNIWDGSKTWPKNSIVEQDNVLYAALQESSGVEPGVDENWEDYWMELDGYFIKRCQAQQSEPANIGRDDKNRIRFSVNFEIRAII